MNFTRISSNTLARMCFYHARPPRKLKFIGSTTVENWLQDKSQGEIWTISLGVICIDIWIFTFCSLRFKVLGTGELLITNLRFNDMGTYICLAKNSVSKDVVSTFLYPLANKKWTRGLWSQQPPSRHPHDGNKYTKHSAIISTNILTFIHEMSPQNDT